MMDDSQITARDICGKWHSSEHGDFIIFESYAKCFISFHEKYRWGKKIGEIKYFVQHINNGEFYFEKKGQFYEIWYNQKSNTISLKLCDSCERIK